MTEPPRMVSGKVVRIQSIPPTAPGEAVYWLGCGCVQVGQYPRPGPRRNGGAILECERHGRQLIRAAALDQRQESTMTAPGTILDRLRRAVELATEAADRATQGDRAVRVDGGIGVTLDDDWTQVQVDFGPQTGASQVGCMLGGHYEDDAAVADARLVKASGPNHWRAVAAALQSVLDSPRLSSDAVQGVAPLVSQIINELGTDAEATDFWVCRYPAGPNGETCGSTVRSDRRAVHMAEQHGLPPGVEPKLGRSVFGHGADVARPEGGPG